MKTVLELNRPTKTRKPREVTIAELRAEIRELKAWNREVRKVMHKLSGELTEERAHVRELLAITRRVGLLRGATPCCTCTPTRADFLRAIAP
jgi:hypothetical protein